MDLGIDKILQMSLLLARTLVLSWFFEVCAGSGNESQTVKVQCKYLLMGQFRCNEPQIDHYTQQASGCKEDTRTVSVQCKPAPDIVCISDGGEEKSHTSEIGYFREVPCKWTNGYEFETALLLSVFLGMFGIDRFYLGYPAIGLLKFSTLGFFFLGQLIDVLLIATQIVKPSDGSDYIINYYGAGLKRIYMDNETIVKTF